MILNMAQKDIIINDFQKGIGQSYNADFYNFRNLDVSTSPGSVKIARTPVADTLSGNSVVTATAATDTLTLTTATYFATGTPVTFTTTDTLPDPLAVLTTYYLIRVDNSNYKVATNYANALADTQIDITDTGTGAHTLVAPVMSLIKKFINHTKDYAIDSDNKVWFTDTTWQVLGGHGNGSGLGYGIEYWKDYLFVIRNTNVDVWGPISGTPAWSLDWFSISGNGDFHPTLVGQDDILYIGAGRFVASVQEVAGQNFAPGTGGTFSQNATALDLPEDYVVTTLEELGTSLMIGTKHSYKNVATMFPWDRVSSSFDLPVEIQEDGIKQMINISNILYFTAGSKGGVFVSDGTSTRLLVNLPNDLIGIDTNPAVALSQYTSAIMNLGGKLCIGVGAVSGLTNLGIYEISTDGAITLRNVISTGNAGGTNALYIGALLPTSNIAFYAGWRDNTTIGIDRISQTNRYTSYLAYFETGLMQVGTTRRKREFKEIEITFARELPAGAGIKLYYRENLTDSYTLIDTIDYSSFGAISYKSLLPPDLQFATVQFKVEFTAGTNQAYTPELASIRLI